MIYLEKNKNEVIKYNITIKNEKKLLELRKNLIDEYSSILKFRNYYSLTNVDNIVDENIRNYSNNDFIVNFDYLIFPELVSLIDSLLNENGEVINDIVNYNPNIIITEKQLIEIQNNIMNKLNINIHYKELVLMFKDNIEYNEKDYNDILEKILKCIKIVKCDSISLDRYNNFLNFLNQEDKLDTNKSIKNKVKINKWV